jgi:hypothetical protein
MAARETPSGVNPVDQLAWEAKWGRWAGIAAALGGILMLLGGFITRTQIMADYPSVGPLQAIAPALNGQASAQVSPGTKAIEFLDDRAFGLIAMSVVTGIGTVLTGLALVYLYAATKGRRPITPKIAKYTALYGAIAVALVAIVSSVVLAINAHDFLAGTDRSHDAVKDVQTKGLIVAIQSIGIAAQLAVAFAFVMVSLNAMRAGLLTRFMGVLGIISGALFILQFGQPLPVVQCFWLVALAALFLRKWPNGMPPAWTSGEAMPWPSQQEIREAKARDQGLQPRGGASAAASPDDDDDVIDAPAGSVSDEPAPDPRDAPNPSSSRKRRKRR